MTDATLFSSGRVKVIPFEKHFTEAEQDRGLKGELCTPENLSGILNWCLAGLALLNRAGFAIPQSVKDATDVYRSDSDKAGRFLAEECEPAPTAEVKTQDVYTRYRVWCERNGHRAENAANFNAALRNNGIEIVRKRPVGTSGSVTTLMLGYRLLDEAYDDPF